jgi:hypothetical protein
MRIEEHHGRNIVCGHIFPIEEVEKGQVWQSSSGGCVIITKVCLNQGQVHYAWEAAGGVNVHVKDSFAFQCRYCKIVD